MTEKRRAYNRKYYLKNKSKIIAQARKNGKKYLGTEKHLIRRKRYMEKYRLTHKAKRYQQISIDGRKLYLHRHLIEQHLGRKLSTDEVVHHLDHNTLNNELSNLAVMSRESHSLHHNPLVHKEELQM